MGRLKQVMEFKGKPMVRHIAEALLTARLKLLVVIGHEREQVKQALQDLPCEYVINEHPEDGMFSSVRLGCLRIPEGEACLITTCDCPGIHPDTIRRIKSTLEQQKKIVIIPTFQGRRGHPAGLPAFLVEQIRSLPPDTPGLNSLWNNKSEMLHLLDVDDPAVLRDFDRPEDLCR